MATHSIVLAWRILGTGKPGGLPSMGLQSWTRLKRLSSSSSILTNKMLIKQKNQKFFIYPWEKCGHRENCCPRTGEVDGGCGESQPPRAETCTCQSRKAWTIMDELLEAQYRQVWELETPEIPSHWWGGGITFMGFPYRSSNKCIKWISEKSLFMLLARGAEKELFLKTPEHSVLLNKSLLSEDILPEPIWGKGNIQLQPSSPT